MPFLPALCLVFVLAKLAGWITWSWFWVFSPILIPAFIALIILAFIGLCMLGDTANKRRFK